MNLFFPGKHDPKNIGGSDKNWVIFRSELKIDFFLMRLIKVQNTYTMIIKEPVSIVEYIKKV